MVSRRGSGRSDVSYVGRGGEKLAYALDAFGIKVEGYTCADLGCNVGGFADCLLARGARRVYAVDTGYGMLAWKLRIDPRVVVMERTNALHLELPEAVDLAAVDVGWTRQARIIPAALGLLKSAGCVVSLVKPQYEAKPAELAGGVVRAGCISDILGRVMQALELPGVEINGPVESPLKGGAGNVEYFIRVRKR